MPDCRVFFEKCKVEVGLVLAPMAVLTAMGAWFCWSCPSDWLWSGMPHFVFWRQLAWNMVALSLFALGAYVVPWRRWLDAAPWLALVWCVLFLAAQNGPAVDGRRFWVALGPLGNVDVRDFMPAVLALFGAWFCDRTRMRLFPTLLLAVGGFYLVAGVSVLGNAEAMARVGAVVRGEGIPVSEARIWALGQLVGAFKAASWFSGSDLSLHYLPRLLTSGMPASSALVFGKWFMAVVWMFLGLFCFGAVWTMNRAAEPSKRFFILAMGLSVLLPSLVSYLGCFGIVPSSRGYIPLVSYGGVQACSTWLMLGAFVALLRDRGALSAPVSRQRLVQACLLALLVLGGAVAQMGLVRSKEGTFSEQRPDEARIPRSAWL